MKSNILTLCDYAKDYNGQLTINGTFDEIKAVELPVRVSFCIASQYRAKAGSPEIENLIFSIRNKKTGEFIINPQEIKVLFSKPSESDPEREITSNVVFYLNNISIPMEGAYELEMRTKDEVKTLEFYCTLNKSQVE